MHTLIFTVQFDKSFSKIKDYVVKKQIWNKIFELENRVPIGKKLKGNPYWSIHVNKYRIIYEFDDEEVRIADILLRKNSYRDIPER